MISAAWIEAKNRSTNRGSVHWRTVVQQWTDPQTWIQIVERSTVGHAPVQDIQDYASLIFGTQCILQSGVNGCSITSDVCACFGLHVY